MKKIISVLFLCLFLTGCLGFWFDREPDPVGSLENQGVSQSRAEKMIERGKQHVDRIPFPWGWVAGAALVVAGVGAKVISDKRERRNG